MSIGAFAIWLTAWCGALQRCDKIPLCLDLARAIIAASSTSVRLGGAGERQCTSQAAVKETCSGPLYSVRRCLLTMNPFVRPTSRCLELSSPRAVSLRRNASGSSSGSYGLYPEAPVEECLDTPHNRMELGERDALSLHRRGKQTLVFGELKAAVRFSRERGNACPNYWHFSPYGFCPYGCHYCYLAGTPGVWFSPTVKIFLNLEEILSEVDQTALQLGRPTAFFLVKL